jgi:hypothetical protein
MFGAGRIESSNRTFADRYFLLSRVWFGERTAMLSALRQQIPLLNDDFVQYLRRAIVARLMGEELEKAALKKSAVAWERLPQEQRLALKTAAEDHRDIGQFHEPFEWYARIVEFARARQMRVVAVRYPGDPDYFSNVTPEQVAVIDAHLKKIGVTEILDYRSVFENPADFVDPDHVSRRGAYKILRMLEVHLGRPLISDHLDAQAFDADSRTQ